MADIWKIGQDMKAEEFYKKSLPMMFGDIQRVNLLADVCNGMSKSYEQTIEDQNSYLLEIDAQMDEVEKLQQELERQIKERKAEQEKLTRSAGEEGLSEEDKDRITELNDEINALNSETNSKIEGLRGNIKTTSDRSKSDLSKAEIAMDYGSTAIEKGQPLAEMQDKKKSFWRKTFGGWNKSTEREVGKKAVDAGNDLLDKVSISSDIEKDISKKTRVLK